VTGTKVDRVVRVDPVPVGAREVDDGAAATFEHHRPHGVTHPHRSDHINLKEGARRGGVQLAESHRVRLVEAAGGVDEDVQPTVALNDVGDERVDRLLIRDVEGARVSLPAPALQFRHDFRGLGARGAIADRNRGALRTEASGNSSTKRPSAPGDHRHPSLEAPPIIPLSTHASPSVGELCGQVIRPETG
jgi:hypothetical protein